MERDQKIPKIIHYFGVGKGESKKQYQRYIDGWRRLCPDFKIERWDESNFDVTANRFAKEAYDNGCWAFVSDYARLKVLYEYGGIQLDTDVEMLKSYSDLLCYEGFIGFESDEMVNDGQAFGVIPHHPIVKEMLDMYEGMSFVNEDGSFNQLLSPDARTEVLKRHGLKTDGSRQNIEGIEVFPVDYFCPMDFYSRKIKRTPNTYSIHHFAASWHSRWVKKDMKRKNFFCALFGTEKGLKIFKKYKNFKKFIKKL